MEKTNETDKQLPYGTLPSDKVMVKKLIVCTKTRRGACSNKLSPIRVITEVFDLDGRLIAESDPHSTTLESVTDFIKYRFKGEEQEKVLEWAWEYFIEETE